MKTNANPKVLAIIRENGLGADCVYLRESLEGEITVTRQNRKCLELLYSCLLYTSNVNYEALKPAYDSSYIVEDSDVVLVKDIFEDVQGGEWFGSYVQYVLSLIHI